MPRKVGGKACQRASWALGTRIVLVPF
jgi:hypothetical protein